MKKIAATATFVLASLLAMGSAGATEVGRGRSFGLGLQFGNPTAITGKVFSGENSLAFGLGWGGWGPNWGYYGRCWDPKRDRYYYCDGYGNYRRNFSLHADYLWENNLVDSTARLNFYAGVGGRVVFWDANDDSHYFGDGETALIARVPLGLDIAFRKPDFLELFIEIDPGFFIAPAIDFHVDAALGFRLYF